MSRPDYRPQGSRGAGLAADATPLLTFFREWLRNPFAMAAVSPSGRQLAGLMVGQLPPQAQRVIEFGGGTGAFTRALLDSGVAPRNLLVIELNEALHRLLGERFPSVHVEWGDARDAQQIARRSGVLDPDGHVDAVVSGLGLLYMPQHVQREILGAAFAVLGPRGRFVQFTYGPISPVPRSLLQELDLGARRAGTAWRNVPPANVFVYQRRRSRKIESVRSAGRSGS
jgi:phosphatidylethanolamine/phosphatidyl-N-methylethanolamine N-methyltransferase